MCGLVAEHMRLWRKGVFGPQFTPHIAGFDSLGSGEKDAQVCDWIGGLVKGGQKAHVTLAPAIQLPSFPL